MNPDRPMGAVFDAPMPGREHASPLDSIARLLQQQHGADWVEVSIDAFREGRSVLGSAGTRPFGPGELHTLRLVHGEDVVGAIRIQARHQIPQARLEHLLEPVLELVAGYRRDLAQRSELRDRAEFMRSVLNGLAQPVYVKDVRTRRYVAVNDAFCRTLGRQRGDILDRTDDDLFDRRTASHTGASDDDAVSTGTVDFEERIDDRTYLTSKRVRIIQGVQRLIGLRTDISAQKEADASAQRSREESEVKSAFLEIMSHELRTPLNAILGLSEILAQSDLQDSQRTLLETLRSSGGALMGLLDDVLDFVRLQADQLELSREIVDIERLVARVVASNRSTAAQKGLDLFCTTQANAPQHVRTDKKRLRQVLHHLIRNAIAFTAEGHVHVDVRYASSKDAGDTLVLSVRDTGVGMDRQMQQLAFEAFAQVDGSIRRRTGGAGLGLAICHSLTMALGGEIAVDSAPGVGSTFRVCLPLDCEYDPRPADLVGRVAIVHPHASWRYAMRRMLDGWGIDIQAADDIDRIRRPADVFLGDPAAADQAARSSRFGAVVALTTSKRPLCQSFDAGLDWPPTPSALRETLEPLLCRAHAAPRDERPEEPRRKFDGTRVLIVEDNVVNSLVARRMCEELGCTVTLASCGKEALRAATRDLPDAILMDLHMPEMDGWEATSRLREMGMEVPISALTASASEDVRERCFAAGMNAFLSKPLSMLNLERTLRAILSMDTRPGDTWS
jgi:signal transduction histidine kinase/CheY-like chemotaxis protein